MTREEKIRHLSRYKNLEKEISMKREEIVRLRSESERVTSMISGIPRGENSEIQDKTAETVAKLLDLVSSLNEDIVRLVNLRKSIEETIKSLENSTYRILLTKRYIEGKKWENIAVEMNYAYRHIRRLHNRAINQICPTMSHSEMLK